MTLRHSVTLAVVFCGGCELVGGIEERRELVEPLPSEGGECVLADTRPCYEGPPGTRGVGRCADGEQTCHGQSWGLCSGAIEPEPERCDDGVDHDCDGRADCYGPTEWSRAFGDSLEQYARGGAVLPDGRFVVAGEMAGSMDLDGELLIAEGSRDLFVAAFDPDGAVSWARSFGGADGVARREVFAVASLPDGDVVVVGTLDGTLVVDGTEWQGDDADAVALRLGPEGQVRWSRLYPGPGTQRFRDVAVDPESGDLFIVGAADASFQLGGHAVTTSPGRYVAYVLRMRPDGAIQWVRDYGGPSDVFGTAVAVTDRGEVVATGNGRDAIDFGAGLLEPGPVVRTSYVAKWRQDGALVTARVQGVSGWSQGEELAAVPGGDVIVAGALVDQAQIDFGTGIEGGDVDREVFVARLDDTLAPVATRIVPFGLGVPSIALDPAGYVVLGALHQGAATYGGATLASFGGWDISLVKLTWDLEHRWSREAGSPLNDDVAALGVLPSGDILAAGRFGDALDWGSGALSGAGDRNLWVARFGP